MPKASLGDISFQAKRYSYPISYILSAKEATEYVMKNAGANKGRDSVDRRFVEEVRSFGKLGQIVDDEKKAPFNGVAVLKGGMALKDSDGVRISVSVYDIFY